MRELREETGLSTKKRTYLFSYHGRKWHTKKGSVKNHAKVFLIKAHGRVRPRHEIKYIAYWKPGCRLKISSGTKKLIKRYLEIRKNNKSPL